MKADTREQLDRFWVHELGLEARLTRTPRMCCTVQHVYPGVQLFTNGERLVIAVPPAKVDVIRAAIAGVSLEEVFSVGWLQHLFASDAERILGPAEVHYADETSFHAGPHHGGRALHDSDSPARHALVAALSSQEIEESGVSTEVFQAFGAFSDDRLCAVASYEVWKPTTSLDHHTVSLNTCLVNTISTAATPPQRKYRVDDIKGHGAECLVLLLHKRIINGKFARTHEVIRSSPTPHPHGENADDRPH